MPPSSINPANTIGFNALGPFGKFFSYTSLVLRINCLSLIKLSIPIRSTTSNHVSLPTSASAFITHTSDPCVTALDRLAILSAGLRCPVLSKKL